jgi:hypothetical protein
VQEKSKTPTSLWLAVIVVAAFITGVATDKVLDALDKIANGPAAHGQFVEPSFAVGVSVFFLIIAIALTIRLATED